MEYFKASTEVAQLEVISKMCGIPEPADWPEIVNLKYFGTMVTPLISRFHPKPKRQIRAHFCALPSEVIDLIDGLLQLNPNTRLSSDQASKGIIFKTKEMKSLTSDCLGPTF